MADIRTADLPKELVFFFAKNSSIDENPSELLEVIGGGNNSAVELH
jgi:hypothetical protein